MMPRFSVIQREDGKFTILDNAIECTGGFTPKWQAEAQCNILNDFYKGATND